ncbi:MAG: ABC transporter permease [Oscillospiraceae bacterium]|nr:ABC transporter permease [Oscillospiraceae bacterium]
MYFIYYFLSKPQINDMAVRINYESSAANTIQIFYSTDTEPLFSEDRAVKFEYIQTDVPQELYAELPTELTYLRIDFGDKAGIAVLSEPKLCIGSKSMDMDISGTPVIESFLGSIRNENGRLFITTEDTDPYIVFSAEEMKIPEALEHYSSSRRTENIIFAVLICMAVDLVSVMFILNFDELIGIPLNIFRERKMFANLVKNDFQARFAGSYFGVFWAFVQPLITMALYWFVFQVGLRAGNVSDYPFILFLMSGMIPWLYFSEALSGSTNSLAEYSYLVKKVLFNVEIIPALKTASSLFVHIAFVVFLSVICIVYGFTPSLYWLQLLYYIPCTAFLALGLSYITASCTAFFKDTIQIVNIFLTIGVWITPVMWNPVGTIPEALHTVFRLNPVYYIVDGFRDSMLAKVWFWEKPVWTVGFWLISVTVYIIGVKLFNKLKVHFADVL